MTFCIPEHVAIMELRSEIFKCVTLQYAGGQKSTEGRRKNAQQEHINLYCSAKIAKQVTHISWGKHNT